MDAMEAVLDGDSAGTSVPRKHPLMCLAGNYCYRMNAIAKARTPTCKAQERPKTKYPTSRAKTSETKKHRLLNDLKRMARLPADRLWCVGGK